MAKRDSFLLRIDPQTLAEVRRWADDEMRSINAQIEYLLRQSLQQAGRSPGTAAPPTESHDSGSSHAPDTE